MEERIFLGGGGVTIFDQRLDWNKKRKKERPFKKVRKEGFYTKGRLRQTNSENEKNMTRTTKNKNLHEDREIDRLKEKY